jgi:hypothetical protein
MRRSVAVRVQVRVVQFAVYLASLDLAEGHLLCDVVEHHGKMFAFLGEGYYGTVVFHDDGREF